MMHSNTTHGQSRSQLYQKWTSMKARCTRKSHKQWNNYGGRGITVCKEWMAFEPFAEWAINNGFKPHLTLERVNNDEGYSPNNCVWVSQKEQLKNTRVNVFVEAFGERKTLMEWAEDDRCSVSYHALRMRLKAGWPPERAIIERHRSVGGYIKT